MYQPNPLSCLNALADLDPGRDLTGHHAHYLHYATPDRAAVHVDAVYGEEGADPQGLTPGYPRLVRLLDLRYEAVGRSVHDVRLRFQGPLRVPEERESRPCGPKGDETAPPPAGQQKRCASGEQRQRVPASCFPASLRYHRRSPASCGRAALQAKRNAGGTFTSEIRRRTEPKWRSSSFCAKVEYWIATITPSGARTCLTCSNMFRLTFSGRDVKGRPETITSTFSPSER